MKPVIAHCPYCDRDARMEAPGASVYCACEATRVSCDGLNGSIHITVALSDQPPQVAGLEKRINTALDQLDALATRVAALELQPSQQAHRLAKALSQAGW